MEINQKNIKVAKSIAEILEKEKCTVDETREILAFINSISGRKSTVQVREIISELCSEVQKTDPADIR